MNTLFKIAFTDKIKWAPVLVSSAQILTASIRNMVVRRDPLYKKSVGINYFINSVYVRSQQYPNGNGLDTKM